MNRAKFIQILQDADLYNWFRFEFGDQFGENWQSNVFYERGWHIDSSCISFREKPLECELDNYNFAWSDFHRNVLLRVIMSHGYVISRNEPDNEDGWLLFEVK